MVISDFITILEGERSISTSYTVGVCVSLYPNKSFNDFVSQNSFERLFWFISLITVTLTGY